MKKAKVEVGTEKRLVPNEDSEIDVFVNLVRKCDNRLPESAREVIGNVVERGVIFMDLKTEPTANWTRMVMDCSVFPGVTSRQNAGMARALGWFPQPINNAMIIFEERWRTNRSGDSLMIFFTFMDLFEKYVSTQNENERQIYLMDVPSDIARIWYAHADVIEPSISAPFILPNFDSQAENIFWQMCTRIDREQFIDMKEKALDRLPLFSPAKFARDSQTRHWPLALVIYWSIKTDNHGDRRSWKEIEERAWQAMADFCNDEENEVITRVKNTLEIDDTPLGDEGGMDWEMDRMMKPFCMLSQMILQEESLGGTICVGKHYHIVTAPVQPYTFNMLYEKANSIQRKYFGLIDEDQMDDAVILMMNRPVGEILDKMIKHFSQDFAHILKNMPTIGVLPPWINAPINRVFWVVRLFAGDMTGIAIHKNCHDAFFLFLFINAYTVRMRRAYFGLNIVSPLMSRLFFDAYNSSDDSYRAMIFLLVTRGMMKMSGIISTSHIRTKGSLYDQERGLLLPRIMRLLPYYVLWMMKRPLEGANREDKVFKESLRAIQNDMRNNAGIMFSKLLSFFTLFCIVSDYSNMGMRFDGSDQMIALMEASMRFETEDGESILNENITEMLTDTIRDQTERQGAGTQERQDYEANTFFLKSSDEISAYIELICILFEHGHHSIAFQLMDYASCRHISPSRHSTVMSNFLRCSAEFDGTAFQRVPEDYVQFFNVNTFEVWLANFMHLVELHGTLPSSYENEIIDRYAVVGLVPNALEYPIIYTKRGAIAFGDVFLFSQLPCFDGPSPLLTQLSMAFGTRIDDLSSEN